MTRDAQGWATAEVRRAAAALWPDEPGEERRERAALAAWTAIAEPGDSDAGRLVAEVGAVEALRLLHDGERLPAAVDPTRAAAAVDRWSPRLDPAVTVAALRGASSARMRLLTRAEPFWPAGFDDLGAHAPLALWSRGDASALAGAGPAVSVVGARAATPYGEQVAMELAGALAERGVVVASGAAYGIDGVAHRSALGAGGLTVAIVAGGADRVYPAGHARLYADIARSGIILSEVPPGAAPTKCRFLSRNRLLAALGEATVVVEAGARSGSLNTAGHAAELGRPLGAVPGPVTSAGSAGCHRLLREYDATCVTCVDDVMELIGIAGPLPRGTGEAAASPAEIRARDALAPRSPRGVAEIARRSGLSRDEAQAAIGMLELRGEARRRDAGWTLA
jgi:DNA processing protein